MDAGRNDCGCAGTKDQAGYITGGGIPSNKLHFATEIMYNTSDSGEALLQVVEWNLDHISHGETAVRNIYSIVMIVGLTKDLLVTIEDGVKHYLL